MPKVEFKVKCRTEMGESLVAVGNAASLGSWNPESTKIVLTTDKSAYPIWSMTADFPEHSDLEFKFVVKRGGETQWEDGIPNRKLSVSNTSVSFTATFNTKGEKVGTSQSGKVSTSQSRMSPDEAAWSELGGQKPQALELSAQPGSFSQMWGQVGVRPTIPASNGGGYANGGKKTEVSAVSLNHKPADRPSADTSSFIQQMGREDAQLKSYHKKLGFAQRLLQQNDGIELTDLACVQVYLTFIASGQIQCQEDGGHHRPNHSANASKAITTSLQRLAKNGDAERFVVRRIFPALPSYAEQFTCAVPMTRIRDIAHRGDIPHHLKQEIKHTLQNKLHRCADPGDLITCQKLVERIRNERHNYSGAFVEQLEIFYVELKEFFNASNLDEMVHKVAMPDDGARKQAEVFMDYKNNNNWDKLGQLRALSELREASVQRAESSQSWQLLDIELEKYAFVLLSGITAEVESGTVPLDLLLQALYSSLSQLVLSGVCAKEACVICKELISATEGAGQSRSWWCRTLASTERALRLCFGLQRDLSNAYSRVAALGTVLPVDQRAVDVFLEAELRTSILFQVSKLAQEILRKAKVAINLPNWIPICSGTVVGRFMRMAKLEEVWQRSLPKEGAIIFCDEASGEEEIAPGVLGVVVCRDLPVLSHLSVRARQTGVTFVCTSEEALFKNLTSFAEGAPVQLMVSDNGDVQCSASNEAALSAVASSAGKQPVESNSKVSKMGALNLGETTVMSAKSFRRSTPDTVGAKAASSGKLDSLALEDGSFFTPKSCAIPFGVMAKVLNVSTVARALDALERALSEGSTTKIELCAEEVRESIAELTVESSIISSIQEVFKGVQGLGKVAVRSSANSEDLENVSGAGLHDSVLGVDVVSSRTLQQAILQVWGSLFTLRAVQSRHTAKMPLYKGLAMGVLVQQMVYSPNEVYAFIMFSEHVAAKEKDSVYIEMCVGLGETLASANVPGTPYRLSVQKNGSQTVHVMSLGSFSQALSSEPSGGVKRELIDYSRVKLSTDSGFLESLAMRLASVAICVENSYGVSMDIEGVVVENQGRYDIFLVQARPIVKSQAA